MPGPLAGLKVIELCHVMAGPTCGLMLADMGADVIKLEKIPGGDDTRRMVPPTIGEETAAFLMMNRNKRGIAVDLKHADGKRVLWRLLETADVVTENYRRGFMERMGFGYDALRRHNKRLIYCAISGFGRTGPYADRGGFDLVAQGMSGLMSITGEGPGRPPVKVGAPVADITAGILAAMGVLAALEARRRTGEGQMVDTSLFEAAITPIGNRRSRSRPASRPGRWARRTRSTPRTRRSRRATGGSRSAPPTRPTGCACSTCSTRRGCARTRALRPAPAACATCTTWKRP
jgi:crotonobetainyl-CoA:carnitine CoA-transferase CaiB-like acyl-CoA transferase